ALLIAVAVGAIAAERLLFARPELVDVAPTTLSSSLEGEVISVDAGSTKGAPRIGHALVKLLSGERVKALVPNGCSVLPGQTTRLGRHGSGSDISYVVVENGK